MKHYVVKNTSYKICQGISGQRPEQSFLLKLTQNPSLGAPRGMKLIPASDKSIREQAYHIRNYNNILFSQ